MATTDVKVTLREIDSSMFRFGEISDWRIIGVTPSCILSHARLINPGIQRKLDIFRPLIKDEINAHHSLTQ